MLGEWIKKTRAAFAAGVSGTVIAAMVVAVAIISPGYATQRVSLNDGAVWVANLASQALGRANPEVLELNTVIETDVASGEVVQAGESVFLVDSETASSSTRRAPARSGSPRSRSSAASTRRAHRCSRSASSRF